MPDGSVDMVLLYDVLHVDPDPAATRAILSSVARVLKPGGVLSVSNHHIEDVQLTNVVGADGCFEPAGRSRWTCQFAKLSVGGGTT